MANEIAIREEARAPESTAILAELSVEQMAAQVAKIQQLMKAVMKEGEHYGVIPGTNKPSLLQPGAQKLTFTFRLADRDVEVIEKELPNNHREYRVHKQIVALSSGAVLAEAWGVCSTMETKYRYRNVADYEDTGEPIPADSKERKQEYRKQGFGMKKVNGAWLWVKYKDSSRVENPDIADTYNTVLAMADKRAFVRGTIKALAASDLFTHDIEDFTGDDNGEEQRTTAKPAAKPAPEEPEGEAEFHKEDALLLRDMLLSYLLKVEAIVGKERADKLRAAAAKNEENEERVGKWKRFADWITAAHETVKAEVAEKEKKPEPPAPEKPSTDPLKQGGLYDHE